MRRTIDVKNLNLEDAKKVSMLAFHLLDWLMNCSFAYGE